MIQIETIEGIDNLDAILTEVADIDAVWLGTLDTRVSMGLVGVSNGDLEPEYLEAVAKFERILMKHHKPRGGFSFGSREAMREMGKDNCINFVAADVITLAGMAELLTVAKETFPAERKMLGAEREADAKMVADGGAEDGVFKLGS